jgi:hypothetical protein
MSGKIRHDKTCLNCRSVVEKKYCPECGQENIEPRQSFIHLFTHFFEDFTHYDNAFWKTMRYLIFHPARLTREYLAGRRKSFVPPVRLYIFISFVTFLYLSMETSSIMREAQVTRMERTAFEQDSIAKLGPAKIEATVQTEEEEDQDFFMLPSDFKTLRELDSAQNARPPAEKMSPAKYWYERKSTIVREKYKGRETQLWQDGFVLTINSVPKVLFVYLPIFAFFLWLFHNKKKWYYFDHGIFTLHYFSFILLTLLVSRIFSRIENALWDGNIHKVVSLIMMMYWFFYFFRAHSRLYGGPKWKSRLKGIILFFINTSILFTMLVAALLYAILSL